MTLNNVIDQLYAMSVAGYFNGEKYSKREFAAYLKSVFRAELNTRSWVMEIALPDGRWYFKVYRWHDDADGFDYWLPTNRQEEQELLTQLLEK